MNHNKCSGICLFKVIISKFQVDSQSKIYLLIGKLTTGISDLMAPFGKKTANFNKEIRSIGNTLSEIGEESGNILLKLLTTYDDCSSINGPFPCCIEFL